MLKKKNLTIDKETNPIAFSLNFDSYYLQLLSGPEKQKIDSRYNAKKEKLFNFIQKVVLKDLEIVFTTRQSVLSGFELTCESDDCEFAQTFSIDSKRPAKCPRCKNTLKEQRKYSITSQTSKFENLQKVDSSYAVCFDLLKISFHLFIYKKKKHLRGFSEYSYHSLTEKKQNDGWRNKR